MGSNLMINVALSGSLALLWGLINSLQIVAHFQLLVIRFPMNAEVFYKMMLTLATFALIPTEDMSKMIQDWLGFDKPDKQQNEML